MRSLLEMGIKDADNMDRLPVSTEMAILDSDIEVQTASIYNHLDPEYAEDAKKSVWEELSRTDEDNVEYTDETNREIKGATLNKLIDKLTEPVQDSKFLHTFLMTYRSFTVPEILLAKLLERYKVPEKPIDSLTTEKDWNKMKTQIQIRTGNFIQRWIEERFADWNMQMIRMLTIFIDDYLMKYKNTESMAKNIRRKLDRKLLGRDKDSVEVISDPPLPRVTMSVFSSKLEPLDLNEIELARQLTIMEHELYKKIEPSELLNQAWSREKLRHRAPHIIESQNRFNIVSNWVAWQILSPTSLRQRRNNLTKIVSICRHLYELNNFNTLWAFISGTQHAAVYRLKFTKEECKKEILDELKRFTEILSSDGSYKRYRNHVLSVSPPCVPFLGVYLTDLTFVEDGNPDIISSKRTNRNLINWTKRKFTYNVIQGMSNDFIGWTKTALFTPPFFSFASTKIQRSSNISTSPILCCTWNRSKRCSMKHFPILSSWMRRKCSIYRLKENQEGPRRINSYSSELEFFG